MNRFAKYATAAALVGAFALPLATPSMAHGYGRHHGAGAAALGFGAGALVGAAAASAAAPGYYGPDYAYAPDYAYGADYAYAPAAVGYGPGVGAYAAAPGYGGYYNWSDWNEQACMMSPGSINYVPCHNQD